MAGENTQSEISEPKNRSKRRRKKGTKRKRATSAVKRGGPPLAYPKHPILKCLRIPQAVLENNAGKECTDREAAKCAGLGWSGQLGVEISSALKYGLFHRPGPGKIEPTEITRRIARPQKPNDKIDAIREAVLKAPLISDVYKHYRVRIYRTKHRSWQTPQPRVLGFLATGSMSSSRCSSKIWKLHSY